MSDAKFAEVGPFAYDVLRVWIEDEKIRFSAIRHGLSRNGAKHLRDWLSRALDASPDAPERSLAALRAELEEARGLLKQIRDSTYRPAVVLRGMADAFLARSQK